MSDEEKLKQIVQGFSDRAVAFLRLGADLRSLAVLFASDCPKQDIVEHIENMEADIQECSAFLADAYKLKEIFK